MGKKKHKRRTGLAAQLVGDGFDARLQDSMKSFHYWILGALLGHLLVPVKGDVRNHSLIASQLTEE